MIKVLFITYFFPPLGGAGVQRTIKFAKYLPEEGFLPVVVTGPGEAHDRWSPNDGEMQGEICDQVPVYQVKTYPPSSNNNRSLKLQRLFMKSGPFAKWWISSATNVAELACRSEGVKLIYASMSPFESATIADYLCRKFSIPWIADLRDPWALDEMQVYLSYLHRKVELQKMRTSLRSASTIIMNTYEAASILKKTFPEFRLKKVVTITNGYDEEDFKGIIPPRIDSKFRVVHSGYLHTELGLKIKPKKLVYRILKGIKSDVDILTRSHFFFLKAVERWIADCPEVIDYLELLFIGSTTKADREALYNPQIRRLVHFTGYLPHSDCLALVRTADLLFLPMHNLSHNERATIVPGKTYEYMASGRPILAAVPNGDAEDFLRKSGTGFICKPDDVKGMVRILIKVYDAWKKKESLISPNQSFIGRFERKTLTKALVREFNKLITSS